MFIMIYEGCVNAVQSVYLSVGGYLSETLKGGAPFRESFERVEMKSHPSS